MNIYNRIEDLCIAKGLNLNELSKSTNISSNTIYNWKNNHAIPTIPMLEQLCTSFDITLEQFFCGIDSLSLKQEEIEILKKWSCLSAMEKDTIFDLIDTFERLKREKVFR